MRLLTLALGVFLLLCATVSPPLARGATISLNGDWNFVADPSGTLDVQKLSSAENIRPTRIPSSWQSQFADLRDYAGVAWYWRSATVEPMAQDQVALLRFGAVDYLAEVYVNGQKAGAHEGGYLPFELDVTTLLRPGENQIAVRVVDPGAKPSVVEGINYAEIPHGKQSWYVQTSGIWQDVELAIRPRVRLGAVHVLAGADGGFTIAAPIVNPTSDPAGAGPASPARVSAEIRDGSDKVVWQGSRELGPSETRVEFSGRLANPSLWSLASPTLYTLRVALSSGDLQAHRFGFRTLETRGGKFYLNGQPIYLRGALDQDFYPETIYMPPSLDYVKEEMRRAKALGLNLLRCHIKVPDPRYLQAADEVGILVWHEIPNWDKLTNNSQRRALETLRGMVERDWNHPSIVIVSLINESWGANLKEAGDRLWLKQAYREAKELVPRWLVVDNSACGDNFHLATDIADFHHYSAIPDHAADFDRLVDDQAQRPRWLFSPYGDAEPKGDEPLVLSEFGNWGLPRIPNDKPWWFSRGREITRPEGIEQRFSDYQYASLSPDLNALADATQWHQYAALKYEIEAVRAHPEIQGYVITEFTDLNWEANGLLDMWRRPKVYAELLGKLQQGDLLVMRTEKRNFTAGETGRAEVYFSHYSQDGLAGGSVTWQVEGTSLGGSMPVPPLASGSTTRLPSIDFTVPSTPAPVKRVLKAAVVSGGRTLSENSLELYFYPLKQPELPPPVSFHDPAGRLRRLVNEMRARNYLAPTGSEAFPVLIASTFDDEVKKALQAGRRVILIASDPQTLAPGLEIASRTGELDGNWISNFLWIRKNQPPFTSIGFDSLAGFETQSVTPAAVVKGIPPQNFGDVLAGMFYGWLHSSVGTLVQAHCGKGKLLICTFSLATTYGTDPYATYLLDALVNYIVSGATASFEIPSAAP
jgi:hypothetical protein